MPCSAHLHFSQGEDFAAYDELLARVSGGVKPADIVEEIWVRDIVDLTWEIFRWSRVKADLVAQAVQGELEHALEPHIPMRPTKNEYGVAIKAIPQSFYKLLEKWTARDPAAISKVEKLLASTNLTMETVIHRAFAEEIEKIERIDRLIASYESRRNAILREIHRRRAPFAQILRNTVRDIEATEFVTVRPKTIEQNTAADKNAA